MIEVITEPRLGVLNPFSKEARDLIKDLVPGQYRTKVYGVRNPRSHRQLRLYWQMCRVVVDNSDFKSADAVDLYCKIEARLFEEIEVNGRPIVKSIGFKSMPHKEFCDYVDVAFRVMAEHLDVTVDELLNASAMEE